LPFLSVYPAARIIGGKIIVKKISESNFDPSPF